jgi:exodeoxyribonuclease V gamma subunit
MSGLFIFTSNRMELLVERLAKLVRKPLRSSLVPEIVLVQSRGMERWVSMNLARINGICANVRFPFPNAFLEDILRRLRPESDPFPEFEPDVLALRIMKALPRHLDHPDFAHLNAYLQNDGSQLKLYALSRKLADLFDQYSVFRADMLRRWERGAADSNPFQRWQSRLWRELLSEAPDVNRAQLLKDCLDALGNMAAGTVRLPERVSLFGISYLPPLYVQTFEQLSRFTSVNLFLMNPCREYWGDILSDQEVQRMEKRHPQVAEETDALHLERGNRLLSSLGTLGRDFFDLMATLGAIQEEIFEDPQGDSILSCLQSDILNLRDRELLPAAVQAPTARTDTSIRIHSCHSPMREIEVLHDQLLAMFEEDPELLPAEIVVMAPDIDTYAPYISAVFGSQGDNAQFVPFSIADWGGGGQNRAETALCKLLELKGSRLGAPDVLRLLEFEPIRRKFSIADSDRTVIERWVRETGIRWGEDETAWLRLGLPGCCQNTWRAGMERLLLGYAMPSGGADLFQGILAFDAMEGGETQILGNFLEFADRVFELSHLLEKPKTLPQWAATLTWLLRVFVAPDAEVDNDIIRIGRVMEELGRLAQSAEFDQPVSLDVVHSFLMSRLERERLGRGFLAGGVTFCAMLPMRAIPFKVVCLIGMSYDAFPREHQPLSFDLIGRHPRQGDRSRRNDDKYLFLEAVLAARRKLYISYVGQSIQDNSRLPPSVLVSELADTVQKGFQLPASGDGRWLLSEHRLQRFSREYFREGSGLYSYSQEDFIACSTAGQRHDPDPFFRMPLTMEPGEAASWREVTPDRLYAFLSHPARFLVQQRLGIHFEEDAEVLEDREPFHLAPLTRYRIGDALLKHCLTGKDPQDLLPAIRASGEIPHGRVGDHLFSQLGAEVKQFVAKAKRILPVPRSETLEFECEMDGFRLTVRLRELSARGCVQMRYADVTAKDFLRWWLRHLFLCLGSPHPLSVQSLLVGKDAAWALGPVAASRSILSDFLSLYWRGLTEPIPFFPGPSLVYVRKRQSAGAGRRRALASARQRWAGREQSPGESGDPYNRLCHGADYPLGDVFEHLSMQVFQPLFENTEQLLW